MNPLVTSLLDLLFELRASSAPLIIGGGLGLYLKRRHLEEAGARTLFDELPETRSTNDIDLFVRAEVLADHGRTSEIAEAILRLGYEAVAEAKYMQWKRAVPLAGATQEVKIDILVGPVEGVREKLHIKAPRARPKQAIQFHAHCVEEAIRIEERPLRVTIAGQRSTGEAHQADAFVPRAFPYLMMKLFAFSDRKEDERKDVGRHHALDLYNIVGMMTEEEHEEACRFGAAEADGPYVRRARRIVEDDFSGPTAKGALRLREHPLYRPNFLLTDFVGVLREVFPA